jgi:hypothetical protein
MASRSPEALLFDLVATSFAGIICGLQLFVVIPCWITRLSFCLISITQKVSAPRGRSSAV